MLHINCHILPHLELMGRFRQQRGWTHNGRTLEKKLLMVMWQGDCDVTIEDRTFHLESGDAMIIPAKQYYRPRTKEGCEYYYFHFSTAPLMPDVSPSRVIELPDFVLVKKEKRREILLLAQRIYDLHPDTADSSFSLAADLNLTQLLLTLAKYETDAACQEVAPPALLGKLI